MSLILPFPLAPNELIGHGQFKMATIEPRLIHLLNESITPQLSHADLPSRHGLNHHQHQHQPASPDRLFAPIEQDASYRSERSGSDCPSVSSSATGLYTVPGDDACSCHKNDGRQDGRPAGAVAAYPLRIALGDADSGDTLNHSNKLRDDTHDVHDECATKKRTHGLSAKDDFMQLPQPVKKQKATQQTHVMPPIINGLYEPPPHAALFPPISANSLEEHDANQIKLLNDFNRSSDGKSSRLSSSDAEKNVCKDNCKDASKARKRTTKPRRKWSDEETKHLLLGVNKHGVGKWTSILEDPAFKFNDRTAGDLKDRFRTCCPTELRASNKSPHPDSPPMPVMETSQKAKKGLLSENILIEEEPSPTHETPAAHPYESDSAAKQKKSRAHRKNMADLAELGIHGPFKKSQRRERRPFTDQDDREILEGLDTYGPAWTKIQRDPRFNFSARQPTDLRDRVRNKYPDIYHRIEKGTFQASDGLRGSDTMEPSVTISIDNSLGRSRAAATEPHLDRSLSGHPSHSFELNEPTMTSTVNGDMDISRLLLNDSRLPNVRSQRGTDALSGSATPPDLIAESVRRSSP